MSDVFRLGIHTFDVTRGYTLAADTVEVPMDWLRRSFEWVHIDTTHAQGTDPDEPGLVAIVMLGDKPMPVLIDGWHRAYKAHLQDRASFTAHRLTRAQSNAVLRSGPPIPEGLL